MSLQCVTRLVQPARPHKMLPLALHAMRTEGLTEMLQPLVIELLMVLLVRETSTLTTHQDSVQVYNMAVTCDVTLITVQNVRWAVHSAVVLKTPNASLVPMTHYFVIQLIN